MIDTQSAVQAAVYAALNGAAQVTELADVWQNPPENTQPGTKGLVIIGLVSLANEGGKDDDFDRASVSLFTQSRKPDATALYTLNSAVRNALAGRSLSSTGAAISDITFVSANPKLMEDGATYEDQLDFDMFVQDVA